MFDSLLIFGTNRKVKHVQDRYFHEYRYQTSEPSGCPNKTWHLNLQRCLVHSCASLVDNGTVWKDRDISSFLVVKGEPAWEHGLVFASGGMIKFGS